MIIVKKLKPEQFKRLEKIFEEEFDSDAPLPENSDIFAAFENGKLVGFVLAEQLVMIGQIFVIPEKRTGSTEVSRELLKELRKRFEGKEVIGAIASEPRFGNLYKALGMQKISGDFYRRNIDAA